ncbi:MAG: GspH/FimT family pseudopilin [Gammaproteobacteria bacterium]|nr:GspH/FimT family pseudopilin [Gammaproteobacteria bacterium]
MRAFALEKRPFRRVGNSGFTLIELITTLVIASILMTIAVPSFQTMARSNQISSQINGLVADLTLARTEAVKRMTVVTICNSDDQQGCSDTNWADGRIVWVDANVNGIVDNGEILRAASTIGRGASLTTANFTDVHRIQYRPSGSADSTGTFQLCDAENRYCRCLAVGTTGNPSLTDGTCP